MSVAACPFCTMSESRIERSNDLAFVIRDGFPVSPGHSLVIPRRHVGSFFEITDEERSSLIQLLDAQKGALDEEFKPAGYNIGINDGPAAGQTIPHLHIHLIPRYEGGQEDPRGGVRWIFPSGQTIGPSVECFDSDNRGTTHLLAQASAPVRRSRLHCHL